MKVKTTLLLILILTLSGISAMGAQDRLRERIYLQTDKQAYIAGEMIWVKVITTDKEGVPLTFSKVAYVEVIDGSKTAHYQAKLEIIDGVGEGTLILPPMMATGVYRVVAYTNYMKNEGDKVFFEKEIVIANPNKTDPKAGLRNVKPTEESYEATGGEIDEIGGSEEFDIEKSSDSYENITVLSDKKEYSKRSKVNVELKNIPSNLKTLSISIAGDSFLKDSHESNIAKWRYEELNTTDEIAMSNSYTPEYEGHIVNGIMSEYSTGKPTSDERVKPLISFIGESVKIFGGKQGESGEVKFYTKGLSGSNGLVTSISGESADSYRINIKEPFYVNHASKQLPSITSDLLKNDLVLNQSVAVQIQYAYTNNELNVFSSGRIYPTNKPVKSYNMVDYVPFPTMAEVIVEFVAELRFRVIDGKRYLFVLDRYYAGNSPKETLVLVDGIPIFNHETIYNYNPLVIKRIDIYNDKYFFGNNTFEGVVSIITENNDYPGLAPDPSTTYFGYSGTQLKREFFSPVHKKESRNDFPDYRHTLYWNPDLKVFEEDKVIEFYTSDILGNYDIVVEGITTSGEIIYGRSSFIVK